LRFEQSHEEKESESTRTSTAVTYSEGGTVKRGFTCADLDFWVAPISRQHNLIDELKKQELDTPPYDSLAILSDVTGSV
jgi:hypothetical protein